MKKITLISLFVFPLISLIPACKSKTVVRKINTDNEDITVNPIKDFNGVTYRLPRTVISGTVAVKCATSKPGPFVEFLPCFFPDVDSKVRKNAAKPKNKAIEIESPTFDSFGEPDPDENHIVSVKGEIFGNKSLFMEFSPRGVSKKKYPPRINHWNLRSRLFKRQPQLPARL